MNVGLVATDHGVQVKLPGRHEGVIYTDSHSDSEQFATLLRRAGCEATLFDVEPEHVNRTWSA